MTKNMRLIILNNSIKSSLKVMMRNMKAHLSKNLYLLVSIFNELPALTKDLVALVETECCINLPSVNELADKTRKSTTVCVYPFGSNEQQ